MKRRPYLVGAEREEVLAAMVKIAREESPVTIRHLFYRAVTLFPELIPKDQAGARKIGRLVNEARWDGTIKWSWVRDSSRHPVFAGGYRDVADFIDNHASSYRVNAWLHIPDSVTVWCESESALGMIDQLCAKLGIDIYPCRGQPSNDFVWRALGYMNNDTQDGGVAHVYYVGDFDKEGVLIPKTIERKMREEFGDWLECEVEFTRLAVNEEQIIEYALPTKPGKHNDRSTELEAMPGPLLRSIIKDAVLSHMPTDVLNSLEVAEASEKASLLELAGVLGEGVSVTDLVAAYDAQNGF